MAVMAREAWTDERLDDLKETVKERFDKVDKRFDQVDTRFDQVDKRFEQVDKRFEQIDKRFDRVDDKFDSLQRNMTTWFIALFSTILASLITGVFALVSLA